MTYRVFWTLLAGMLALAIPAGAAVPRFAQLPLFFEANQGQFDPAVRYAARTGQETVYLTETDPLLTLARPGAAPVSLHLAGANPQPVVTGAAPLSTRVNYLQGSNPADWRRGLPTYARVQYAGVYPGIDLVFYGNRQRLEHDFVVAPGADPRRIIFEFRDPTTRLAPGLADDGTLELPVGDRLVRWAKPVAYQIRDQRRVAIPARYQVADDGLVSFAVGPYDPERALVIDPILQFSTYLGGANGGSGSADEAALAVAVDPNGNVYLTGFTFSPSFPVVNAYNDKNKGDQDAFLAKIDASGTNLVAATYFGGKDADVGQAIAVDANGGVWIAGQTGSDNFPEVNPFQNNLKGSNDAFVAHFDTGCSNLIFSTYLGGGNVDSASAIAVDAAGTRAYVVGTTSSDNFPVSADRFQGSLKGASDAFLSVFSATGSLGYSSYYGGNATENGDGVAVSPAGVVFLTGATSSTNLSTPGAAQRQLNKTGDASATTDAFVACFDASLTNLVFATYLGGGETDYGTAIAVGSNDLVTVAGYTLSGNFPTQAPFQKSLNNGKNSTGVGDAFVAQLTPPGTNFSYATYLGGNGDDSANGIAVDADGNSYVIGSTSSKDFPLVNTITTTCGGCQNGLHDAFLAKLDATGTNLVYSTFLGGSGDDLGFAVAVDAAGDAYIGGFTESTDFPRANALQVTLTGSSDTFVAKVVDQAVHDLAVTVIKPPKSLTLPAGAVVTNFVTVTIQNRSPAAVTIPDAATLAAVVGLTAESLGACPDALVLVNAGSKPLSFPITIAVKKTLNIPFGVIFNCVNDPVKTAKDAAHDDFAFVATVNYAALPGNFPDSDPADDVCPRSVPPPSITDPYPDGTIKDKGCGNKLPDKTLGAPVVIDLIAP